jgi:serine phosphatase RsbU (regulator of sigma subunit)/anti-sigma regulatory factor (Ser/Thr protein kinase)
MTTFLQKIRLRFNNSQTEPAPAVVADLGVPEQVQSQIEPLDISPTDPLLAYLINAASPVEVDKLALSSTALERLKSEGVKIAVPLVSQGELIGLLNLGPRLSEQDYSSDDRRLLSNLATQAAPALRVAQLAHQQQLQARERERIEQELRVARIIQQTLLPKDVPHLPGWLIDVYWQPAREVSGDFYDFIQFPDGRMGILIADVTDKGVPAALVMATTRSLLRGSAERLVSPGKVLETTNDLLHPDIPARMFVTCLYAVFDPLTGKMVFANAGQNLPYQHTKEGVIEQRATGMPLGLMPGMQYEEKEISLAPGDSLLLSSDGLVEAHNDQREMFGFERVKSLTEAAPDGESLIKILVDSLNEFTGADHEQEDDITLLTIARKPLETSVVADEHAQLITEFELASEPGNERQAAARVLEATQALPLNDTQRQRLETAVSEAALNAIEHGNHYQADLLVAVRVYASSEALRIFVRDNGGGAPIPKHPVEPDLDAKLAGLQSPRGWGLFLIRNMVDELHLSSNNIHHTVELVVYLNGDNKKETT